MTYKGEILITQRSVVKFLAMKCIMKKVHKINIFQQISSCKKICCSWYKCCFVSICLIFINKIKIGNFYQYITMKERHCT